MRAREQLETALLKAHGAGDGTALVDLYAQAADLARAENDIERAGFYLTHAWIFALETGHELTDDLHAGLAAEGRVDFPPNGFKPPASSRSALANLFVIFSPEF